MADHDITDAAPDAKRGGMLDLIEKVGNRLPDPSMLFLLGTLVVMALSAIAAWGNWQVQPRLPQQVMETVINDAGEMMEKPVHDAAGQPVLEWQDSGEPLEATSLLTPDGLFWAISSMVDNFMAFPPLGVVLVGMLGIGIAERTGLIAALLKGFMLLVPGMLLTPSMVFIGIMSSMAMDAGYVVLPPLAALLYKAVGRSPLAGIAAVFAGVSAGFNANLFITGLDPMLAGFATTGGQVIDPSYEMNAACNWWFMVASTFVMTLTGWAVTSFFVERRLHNKPPEDGGPVPAEHVDMTDHRLTSTDMRGLLAALGAFVVTLGAFILMILIPNGPLNGQGDLFDRWVEAIVPMIFFIFIIPGLAFGVAIGNIRQRQGRRQAAG
jgi:aminobenzoyl-glutamate transport protein